MRKLIATIAVLAVVLGGLDIGARLYAESWVAGQLERSLAMSSKPSVTFGGVLFLPEVLTGHVSSASVKATNFSADGFRFEEFTLNLHSVRFSAGKLLLRHGGTIRADSGGGSLSITDQDVTRAFRRQGIDVTVRFSGGLVRVSGDSLPGEVGAAISIDRGDLVLKPVQPPAPVEFRLPLPQVIPGLTYRDAGIVGSTGIIEFTIRNAVFEVPKG